MHDPPWNGDRKLASPGVGADCTLMAVVHVAHDCALGNNVIVANNAVMGGHVSIADHAVIGGGAAIHQFVRIGRAAMIGGVSGVEADVIPFGSVIGNRARLVGAEHVIGLKRRGFDQVTDPAPARRLSVARCSAKTGCLRPKRLEADARTLWLADALVAEMLAFIDGPSHRGLIRAD